MVAVLLVLCPLILVVAGLQPLHMSAVSLDLHSSPHPHTHYRTCPPHKTQLPDESSWRPRGMLELLPLCMCVSLILPLLRVSLFPFLFERLSPNMFLVVRGGRSVLLLLSLPVV